MSHGRPPQGCCYPVEATPGAFRAGEGVLGKGTHSSSSRPLPRTTVLRALRGSPRQEGGCSCAEGEVPGRA